MEVRSSLGETPEPHPGGKNQAVKRPPLFLLLTILAACNQDSPTGLPREPFRRPLLPSATTEVVAYVTNQASGTVSVIETSGNTVAATVTVGDGPGGVAITPDGAFAYVSNFQGSGTVSVIETSTNTVAATVTVGGGPHGVAITPDGAFAYVTNANGDNVSVIETSTNTVTATVTVGDSPFGVAITLVTVPCTLEQLSEAIDALGPNGDGTLNGRQANGLLSKVHQAEKLIGKNKLGEAIAVLEGFLQQVEDLEADAVLDGEQADDLTVCAEEIIEELES